MRNYTLCIEKWSGSLDNLAMGDGKKILAELGKPYFSKGFDKDLE